MFLPTICVKTRIVTGGSGGRLGKPVLRLKKAGRAWLYGEAVKTVSRYRPPTVVPAQAGIHNAPRLREGDNTPELMV